MLGRWPAAGTVAMVLQVLDRRGGGGEGATGIGGSMGDDLETMDPRRWVIPSAKLCLRFGEPGTVGYGREVGTKAAGAVAAVAGSGKG